MLRHLAFLAKQYRLHPGLPLLWLWAIKKSRSDRCKGNEAISAGRSFEKADSSKESDRMGDHDLTNLVYRKGENPAKNEQLLLIEKRKIHSMA